MSQPIISTRHLSKTFGQTQALIGIDLSIAKGTTTGLVGPNGAGKTTLFSLLCGYLKPSQGEVEMMGHAPNSPAIRGRFSILPQDASLLKNLSVGKQLMMLAELQGFDNQQATAESKRVLKAVNLIESYNQTPERLSHGMQKRVAIAQAFIGDPEVILLDEPTAGLDPNTTDAIKSVIRQLSKSKTIIITSHNLEVIEDLCEQIIILKKGRLHSHQAVSELTDRTRALTFRLESDPPADVANIFSQLAVVTEVKLGQPGQHRMVVKYEAEQHAMAEIEIIKCLAEANIAYREMIRGERLQDTVADQTR